ncbi:MAG: hypothetical protein WBQ79_17230 [Acidobacteriaceae bacterium]
MSQDRSNRGDRKKWRTLLWSVLIIIGMVSMPFVVEYRDYAHALAWHLVHGNDAVVGEHHVRLPLLWWQAGSDRWHTSVLQRAWPARRIFAPTIKVAPIWNEPIASTDEEELLGTQSLVAIAVEGDQTVSKPFLIHSSLVALTAKSFTLYCSQSVWSVFDFEASRALDCRAAKVPYSFNYWAPLYLRESKADRLAKEAKSILTTLQ